MRSGDLELQTADGPMRVYEARPEGEARAAVVVIQEAFGVNDHIEDVTRRFADEGYHAAAPALFHRSGDQTAPYDDFSKVMPLMQSLTDDAVLMDVDATLGHLRASGWRDEQIGIVGYCMGGRITFLVAARRAIGASVGYYGGGIVTTRFPTMPGLIDEVGTMKTPWLGLFGDKDAGIPVDDVERLRKELDASAPVAHDIVRYPEAEHGFNCDARPAYHAESAADAWRRTLSWFDEHLASANR